MEGTCISFESRVPTQWEMNARNCQQYIMTCDQPWDPSQVKVAAVRSTSLGLSNLRSLKVGVSSLHIEGTNHDLSTHRCLSDISNTLDDKDFTRRMISQVKVECVYPPYEKKAGTTRIAGAMHSETRHTTVTAEEA
jgi:hypothetical protein